MVDCGRFSLPEKKRYAKNIRIGDPYDPYELPICPVIRIDNTNFCNITLLKNEYTND